MRGMNDTATILTPTHPRWREFADTLGGPGYCDFQMPDEDASKATWDCTGHEDRPHARRLMATMGFSSVEIEAALGYFDRYGGHCDCEILFNVDRGLEDD